MIRHLGIYFITFLLLSLIGYFLHTAIFSELASKSIISLAKIYTFFGSFSFILCTSLILLYQTDKFKDQIGFFYLTSVALKIIFFCFFFYNLLFTRDSFTNQEVINFLIPMFLMLVFEVFFIRNLLNNSGHIKNVK